MIKTILLHFILTTGFFLHGVVLEAPELSISFPGNGQVLQGIVEVTGSIPEDGFEYAELSYYFEGNDASTSFLITRIDQPVQNGLIGLWDTTIIMDGSYRLKLVVYQQNGKWIDSTVDQLKVGNYTHFDPLPPTQDAQEQFQSMETPTTEVRTIDPTSLPENPASIDRGDLSLSVISGLLLTIVFLLMVGVYTLFRQNSRR
ncbi:MAG: hypothetical protein NTZ74_07840 [Chloroflexi bacterium]|nr:hypothetical protein [Chloroflexota bacterium]